MISGDQQRRQSGQPPAMGRETREWEKEIEKREEEIEEEGGGDGVQLPQYVRRPGR